MVYLGSLQMDLATVLHDLCVKTCKISIHSSIRLSTTHSSSIIYLFIHPPIPSFIHPPIHSLSTNHSSTIHSFIHPSTYHLSIHPSIHLSIHSHIYSSIHPPSISIYPPPPGVQMSLGKSLLALESPILVESLSLIWKRSRLPAPSQVERYWGCWGQVKYQGQTHSWSRH